MRESAWLAEPSSLVAKTAGARKERAAAMATERQGSGAGVEESVSSM